MKYLILEGKCHTPITFALNFSMHKKRKMDSIISLTQGLTYFFYGLSDSSKKWETILSVEFPFNIFLIFDGFELVILIKSSAYKKRRIHYISKLIQRAHVKTIHTLFFIRNQSIRNLEGPQDSKIKKLRNFSKKSTITDKHLCHKQKNTR